jgi:hypothetical protein
MPNWKKLIVSGSDASLNNLIVNNAVSASYFVGDGSALTNITTEVSEVATVLDTFTSQTAVSITHNFGTKNVLVSVYNNSDQLILPATTTTTDDNTVDITFDTPTTGRIVVAKGGHLVSGSISFGEVTNNPFTAVNNSITASGHFIPNLHETYDLGSSTYRWRDLYLSGSTIDLGGTLITRDVDGNVEFKESGTLDLKTLRVKELEIGTGDSKTKIKLDSNNKVSFEKVSDSSLVTTSNFFKTSISSNKNYTIVHNLEEEFPIVQIYDTNKKQVIPKDITSVNTNTVHIEFDTIFSGKVVIKK